MGTPIIRQMHQPALTVPRFQRKRSYDELAWSRAAHIRATDSDSDDSAATVLYGREPTSELRSPPTKLRCNCAHMAISPKGDSADSPVDFEVFLGGSCGSHMWRRDTAIPVLEESGISYYNPQLEEGAWHSGLIAIEAEAKEKATVLMFVVDGVTRGMASMIEVTAAVMSGRAAVIVVEHVPEGAVIAGDFVSDNERKDLNRARDYLVQVVEQKMKEGYTNIQLCSNISEASQQAALLAKELRDSATLSCHGSCH